MIFVSIWEYYKIITIMKAIELLLFQAYDSNAFFNICNVFNEKPSKSQKNAVFGRFCEMPGLFGILLLRNV